MKSLLFFLAAMSVYADTKPTVQQIAVPSVQAASVWMVLPGGGFALVPLDGVTIVVQGGVVKATVAQPFTEVWNETVTLPSALQIYPVKSPSTNVSALRVHRNGIRLTPGVDYTLSGATITFVQGAIPQAGDVITCDYRYQ